MKMLFSAALLAALGLNLLIGETNARFLPTYNGRELRQPTTVVDQLHKRVRAGKEPAVGSDSTSGKSPNSIRSKVAKAKEHHIEVTKKGAKVLGQPFKGQQYPMAPDNSRRGQIDKDGKQSKGKAATTEVQDVFTNIHGAYLGIKGTPNISPPGHSGETTANTEHVYESQWNSDFWNKLAEKEGEEFSTGLILANHDIDYFNMDDTYNRDEKPRIIVDYTKPAYVGSLLQHTQGELGGVEHEDRLAMIGGNLNLLKGRFFGRNTLNVPVIGEKREKNTELYQELGFEMMQLHAILSLEKSIAGFCGAADAQYAIFNRLDEDMKKAATTTPGTPAPLGPFAADDISDKLNKLKIGGTKDAKTPGTTKQPPVAPPITPDVPKTPVKKPDSRPQRNRPTNNAIKPPSPGSSSDSSSAGKAPSDNETPMKDRKFSKGDKVPAVAVGKDKGDVNQGPRTVAARETRWGHEWQKYNKERLNELEERMKEYKKDVLKGKTMATDASKTKSNAKVQEKWDLIAKFSITFPKKVAEKCKTWTEAPTAGTKEPLKVESSSSQKKDANSRPNQPGQGGPSESAPGPSNGTPAQDAKNEAEKKGSKKQAKDEPKKKKPSRRNWLE